MWHDSFVCVFWTIHTCDMTYSYVGHDSFSCVTWLICMCDMTHSHVWHDSFTRVTWLIRMCDMTHSHVWHDSFICVTWLIHMCDMTHSHVWHDSFTCVTWLIHMCDMTHRYSIAVGTIAPRTTCVCVFGILCYMYDISFFYVIRATWLIIYVPWLTFIRVTWLDICSGMDWCAAHLHLWVCGMIYAEPANEFVTQSILIPGAHL